MIGRGTLWRAWVQPSRGGLVLDERLLGKVLDAAAEVDRVAALDEVPHLLTALSELVRCDVLFWNRYAFRPQLQEFALVDATTTRPVVRAPLDGWLAHLGEHPIMSGRHGPVVTLSDVLNPPELERTWLFQEALKPVGLRHEMGLELSHPSDEMSVVVFSRGPGRDFGERDRLLLRLLRPHVDAALRRAGRPRPRLTGRERGVLLLVREGLTDAQVARRLGIAEATVGKHLEHVYARVGARSRVQVLALCADELDHPPPTQVAPGRGAVAATISLPYPRAASG